MYSAFGVTHDLEEVYKGIKTIPQVEKIPFKLRRINSGKWHKPAEGSKHGTPKFGHKKAGPGNR